METSLKTGFAQVFYCCPKNLSCPNFGGAAAPLAPPARTPMQTVKKKTDKCLEENKPGQVNTHRDNSKDIFI